MPTDTENLVTLTADIVSAHVGNNSVSVSDVGTLIGTVFTALQGLNRPAEPVDVKPVGAVSIRASVKPDHLISMIDGKSYKMLKRHLSLHGYTPESYRQAFNLPHDYPMVAAAYATQRRTLALKIGLGRVREDASAKAPAAPAAAASPTPAAKTRKPRAKKEPA